MTDWWVVDYAPEGAGSPHRRAVSLHLSEDRAKDAAEWFRRSIDYSRAAMSVEVRKIEDSEDLQIARKDIRRWQ